MTDEYRDMTVMTDEYWDTCDCDEYWDMTVVFEFHYSNELDFKEVFTFGCNDWWVSLQQLIRM